MNDLASQILIGVFSGLATGIVILLFTQVWQKILLPWYEQRLYKGIRISGTWQLVDEQRDDSQWTQRELLIIKQNTHRLSGHQILYPKEAGVEDIKTLDISSEIRDGYVVLAANSKDPSAFSRGAFLGRVTGAGDILEGQATFVNVSDNKILAEKVRYRKQIDGRTT
jgi:hypothetical protein